MSTELHFGLRPKPLRKKTRDVKPRSLRRVVHGITSPDERPTLLMLVETLNGVCYIYNHHQNHQWIHTVESNEHIRYDN